MRKSIIITLVSIFLLGMLFYAYIESSRSVKSTEVVDTKTSKNFLLDIGTPENYLLSLDDHQINKYYDKLKGKKNIKFKQLVTKPDHNDDLSMSLAIFEDFDKETERIVEVTLIIEWIWADYKPFIKGEDFILVNWDSKVFGFAANSFSTEHYYYENNLQGYQTLSYNNRPATANQDYIGYYVELENQSTFTKKVKGDAITSLIPISPTYKGDNETFIRIDYTHNKNIFLFKSQDNFSLSAIYDYEKK